jgi:hypothetical protein
MFNFKFNSQWFFALFAALLTLQSDVSHACQNSINPSMNAVLMTDLQSAEALVPILGGWGFDNATQPCFP